MTSRRAILCALSETRRHAVWFFVALVVLAGAERRIADIRHTLVNLGTPHAGVASDETIDGDEVALRLIALDDAERVAPPADTAAHDRAPSPRRLAAPSTRAWSVPPLRAPPASSVCPTA